MRSGQIFVVVGLGLALAAGGTRQATAQGAPRATASGARRPLNHPTPGDPYERFNRRVYATSMAFDRRYFLPLARVYGELTGGFVGKAIHNVLTNLSEPVIIANDVLQARFKEAGRDFVRLTTNSLVGWGGLIDVATRVGLPQHENDFGVTLGVWGVRPGPYLFLPVLGPSTVRDAIGQGVDLAADPLNFIRFPGEVATVATTTVVGALDTRIQSETEMNALLTDAADPYATLRSVYLQSREAQVRGEGATPALPQLPPMDDEPAPPPAGATPAPSPSAKGAPAPTAASVGERADEAVADPDQPIVTARRFDRDDPTRLAALD